MAGEIALDGEVELGDVRRDGSGTGEAGLCEPETERRELADLRFCNAGRDRRRSLRAPRLDFETGNAGTGGVTGIGGIGGSAGTGGI